MSIPVRGSTGTIEPQVFAQFQGFQADMRALAHSLKKALAKFSKECKRSLSRQYQTATRAASRPAIMFRLLTCPVYPRAAPSPDGQSRSCLFT
jgi:hypothetical protein